MYFVIEIAGRTTKKRTLPVIDFKHLATGLTELRTRISLSEKLSLGMLAILQRFSETAMEGYSEKPCN